jgi:hypothetical protein
LRIKEQETRLTLHEHDDDDDDDDQTRNFLITNQAKMPNRPQNVFIKKGQKINNKVGKKRRMVGNSW